MDELTLIARYAKDHNMTYGQVASLLYTGELKYEDMGIVRKEKPKEKEAKKYVRP